MVRVFLIGSWKQNAKCVYCNTNIPYIEKNFYEEDWRWVHCPRCARINEVSVKQCTHNRYYILRRCNQLDKRMREKYGI